MATATITLTVNGYPNGVDNTQRRQILDGIAALLAGGTYVTDGLPFTWKFLEATGGSFIPDFSTAVPVYATFFSKSGSLFSYEFNYATGALLILTAGAQLANGTVVTADTIGFHAEFVKGV